MANVNLVESNDISITQSDDDITLGIKDTSLNTKIINKNEYSSSQEVAVGKWVDGKTLYRKVYTFPTLANTGNVSVNIDSTFKVQRYDIYVENPNNFKFKLPVMGTNYIASFMDYTANRLTIQTTSDRTAFTQNYAIVEYTKTTD